MKKILAMVVAALFVVTTVSAGTGALKSTDKKSHFPIEASASLAAVAGGFIKQGTSRNGAVYNSLRKAYPNNPVIAPDFIRMEAYLENGKSEYEFFHRLLGNESPTENKLNEQDAFRITDIGIFLAVESTSVKGVTTLHTYPNPIAFPDEAGSLQTAHLEAIYNGKFISKIGDTTYLPGMYIGDTRVVNTAQQTSANNRSERVAGDGFVPLTPQYTLKGRENNTLKLSVPADSNQKVQSTSGTYRVKVVCILRGFKITGAGNTNPVQGSNL